MADSKYTLNGVDLFDTLGMAQGQKPRWELLEVSQPTPPGHKGGTYDNKSLNGVQLASKSKTTSSYLPISIAITAFGDPNETNYLDTVKNFRENKEFIRSLLYKEEWPLLRWFPWAPSNVALPDDPGEVSAWYYFYDSRVRIVPGSVTWTNQGSDRAVLSFVVEIPSGALSSKIHSWEAKSTTDPIGDYSDAYLFPQRLFNAYPIEDFLLTFERADATDPWELFITDTTAEDTTAPNITLTIPSGVKKGALWLKDNLAMHNDAFELDYSWNTPPVFDFYDTKLTSDENWALLKKKAYEQATTPTVSYDFVEVNTLKANGDTQLVVHSSEAFDTQASVKLYYRAKAV